MKFDETSGATAADSSGNGYSATLLNGPAFSSGKLDNALNLASASSQYATLPTAFSARSATHHHRLGERRKLSTWARIFDFGTGTTNYMFLLRNTHRRERRETALRIRTAQLRRPAAQQFHRDQCGAWNHIAITLDGNTATLYINGAVAATNTGMTLRPSSLGATTQTCLGRSQFSADPYFNGAIDDLRIYSRALSPGEIVEFPIHAGSSPDTRRSGSPQQAALTWSPVTNASTYKVKRSLVSGGPTRRWARELIGTSITDPGLTDGATYYYVVSAANTAGESADSSEAGVTPSAPISAEEKLPPVLVITSNGDSEPRPPSP